MDISVVTQYIRRELMVAVVILYCIGILVIDSYCLHES